MSTMLKSFKVTLAATGVAQPLSTTKIRTQGFVVRPDATNVADIDTGDSSVTIGNGMYIRRAESSEKYARSIAGGRQALYDLSLIYIVGTEGDSVRVEYEWEE